MNDWSMNDKLSYFRSGPLLKRIGKTDFSKNKKYDIKPMEQH